MLDLGSGGGIDVLLSARRVGPTGKAYGLDMTDEMLALARENQKKAGAQNVEFLKGEIEHIPLPDNSVDVIISNCVINLSADKDQVIREAFRVLKPGGRFAVSDRRSEGQVPEQLRRDMLLWVGCIAGALEEDEYKAKLTAAGFEQASIEPTRIYRVADAGNSWLAKASTWMQWQRRSTVSSWAPSSALRNLRRTCPAARRHAALEGTLREAAGVDRRRLGVVAALGTAQTLAWGSSYYLPAILADPIAHDLGISSNWFFAAFSASLVISGLLGPRVGRQIDRVGGRQVLCASNVFLPRGSPCSAHRPRSG